jgi:hypothetical protein
MCTLPYEQRWTWSRPWAGPSSGWGRGCSPPQSCSSALSNISCKKIDSYVQYALPTYNIYIIWILKTKQTSSTIKYSTISSCKCFFHGYCIESKHYRFNSNVNHRQLFSRKKNQVVHLFFTNIKKKITAYLF